MTCPSRHVIIAGGICTGKTTLLSLLAAAMPGSLSFREDKGIFLAQMYPDPSYGFANQVDYMVQMLERIRAIRRYAGPVIEDRSIFDTHHVFSRMMFERGTIGPTEFGVLERFFNVCKELVEPTSLILLDCEPEIAFRRMKARDDVEERAVTVGYIERLRSYYLRWYEDFEMCQKTLIRTDHMDSAKVLDMAVSRSSG